MKRTSIPELALSLLALGAPAARADGLEILHDPVACVPLRANLGAGSPR